MKTIKYAVAAIALSTLSFGAFAAQAVSAEQAQNMNKIGVVSAEGASTLDGLEAQLAEKAAADERKYHCHIAYTYVYPRPGCSLFIY